MTADVISLVDLRPSKLNLGTVNLERSAAVSHPFSVDLLTPGAAVERVEVAEELFTVECDDGESRDGKGPTHRCTLGVAEGAPSGRVVEKLVIHTTDPAQPRYETKLYAHFRGAFDTDVNLVDFGEVTDDAPGEESVVVRSTDGRPFAIREVRTDRPELTGEVRPLAGGSSHEVVLTLTTGPNRDAIDGTIVLVTDREEDGEVRLRYMALVQ